VAGKVIGAGTFSLDEYRTVALDAGGGASAYFSPAGARESWDISSISVAGTATNNVPEIRFYRDSAVAGNFVTGSYAGTLDVDSSPNVSLRSGQRLVMQATGGDPGDTYTAHISGVKRIV
jgi:hypothetical protein